MVFYSWFRHLCLVGLSSCLLFLASKPAHSKKHFCLYFDYKTTYYTPFYCVLAYFCNMNLFLIAWFGGCWWWRKREIIDAIVLLSWEYSKLFPRNFQVIRKVATNPLTQSLLLLNFLLVLDFISNIFCSIL